MTSPEASDFILRAVDAIRQADALIITAGAGMGVDSGLPDYRGKEGFWNCYPPYRELGVDYQSMTRPRGLQRNPAAGWGFYGHLLDLYRNAAPHEGYRILLDIGRHMPFGYFVLTTNVDGQFEKASFDPQFIHECHGSVHRMQCIFPCRQQVWPANEVRVTVDRATMLASAPFPVCRYCGALARPALFAFGDTTHVWEYGDEQASRFRAWQKERSACRVVIVECGSGLIVPGLRREGEALMSRFRNASLIRINPREAKVHGANDVSLAMGALEAMAAIKRLL